jgi:hypothetical protein
MRGCTTVLPSTVRLFGKPKRSAKIGLNAGSSSVDGVSMRRP